MAKQSSEGASTCTPPIVNHHPVVEDVGKKLNQLHDDEPVFKIPSSEKVAFAQQSKKNQAEENKAAPKDNGDDDEGADQDANQKREHKVDTPAVQRTRQYRNVFPVSSPSDSSSMMSPCTQKLFGKGKTAHNTHPAAILREKQKIIPKMMFDDEMDQ